MWESFQIKVKDGCSLLKGYRKQNINNRKEQKGKTKKTEKSKTIIKKK